MKLILSLGLLAAFLIGGCAFRPLKPGEAWIMKPDGTVVRIKQSENPKTDSTAKLGDAEIRIGASQKDVAREAAAKLASLRPVMFVGIFVFLFGVGSAFWAPLRVIVGSFTTSLVIAAAGLSLIILPTFVVGNEALILAVTLGGAAVYFFANRYGKARGALEVLKK